MWWLWIPLIVLAAILIVFGLLVFLGRFRHGALLRPIIVQLSKIGFVRRMFQRMSTAAIERQNPELASALKKINTVAANPNPQAMQKAMSRLTPAERRAYMDAAREQQGEGGLDSIGRQERRRIERQSRGGRPTGGGSASRKRKRR
ncbi:MAG TPA: hypothetical protein VH538_02220 [Gaiellaceae bacterium]